LTYPFIKLLFQNCLYVFFQFNLRYCLSQRVNEGDADKKENDREKNYPLLQLSLVHSVCQARPESIKVENGATRYHNSNKVGKKEKEAA